MRLTEDDTTPSARIFVKTVCLEMAEYMGLRKLRLRDGDFIAAPALVEIGRLGARAGQTGRRFVAGGALGFGVKHEQRRTFADLLPFLHRDRFEPPRQRRGGRSRRKKTAEPLEGTFDHGEEGYGLWLDPAVADDATYAEHWAGHRQVEVTVEADQIIIRRAGEDAAAEEEPAED